MIFQLHNFQLCKRPIHHPITVHIHLILLLNCVDNRMHKTVMALCHHHLLMLAMLSLVGGKSSPSQFVRREGETTLINLADLLQICLGVTAGV